MMEQWITALVFGFLTGVGILVVFSAILFYVLEEKKKQEKLLDTKEWARKEATRMFEEGATLEEVLSVLDDGRVVKRFSKKDVDSD